MSSGLTTRDSRVAVSGGDEPITFEDKMILTARSVVGSTFVEASSERGYFADCLFRACRFVNCSFRRCDIEALVFEDCQFENCDFSSADFRSVEFSTCFITGGKFPNGAMNSCTFRETSLLDCRFYRQAFDRNKFYGCTLRRVSFHRSTVLHVQFERCTFEQTNLADCTSLYHVFAECTFERCRMNVDGIASTFGLTRENLASLGLVWQGAKQSRSSDVSQLLDDLLSALLVRGWAIPACLLAVNFSLSPTLDAFQLAFSSLARSVEAGRPIRNDEMEFFAKVTALLSGRGELPFLTVVAGLELCARIASRRDGSEDPFRSLGYMLKEAELATIERWNQIWLDLSDLKTHVVVGDFIFHYRPEASLSHFLIGVRDARPFGRTVPKLIGARSGSYIETVSVTVGTLFACYIVLAMTVRNVDLLILLRAKGEILAAKKLPVKIRSRALEPLPSPSGELTDIVHTMFGLLTGGQSALLVRAAQNLGDQMQQIKAEERPSDGKAPRADGAKRRAPKVRREAD